MQYGKLLGWGIAIYAVMYLLVAILSIYQVSPPVLARGMTMLALISLATLAGLSLRRGAMIDILPYSLFWLLEVALLDALVSVPYAGWRLYLDYNVWIGYSLVLVVPLFASYFYRRAYALPPRA
jgi:hypothetical protein